MLIINWTPFARTYWIPSFRYQRRKALWYVDIRIFRVQFCLYSRKMAGKFLDVLENHLAKMRTDKK